MYWKVGNSIVAVLFALVVAASCAGTRPAERATGGLAPERVVHGLLARFPARYREALRKAAPLHFEVHSLLGDSRFELTERTVLIRIYRRRPQLRFISETGPGPLLPALEALLASAPAHGLEAGRFAVEGKKELVAACRGALGAKAPEVKPAPASRAFLLRRARELVRSHSRVEDIERRLVRELTLRPSPDGALRAAFARQKREREAAAVPCGKLELRLMDALARFARALGHGGGEDTPLALSLAAVGDVPTLEAQARVWVPAHPQYTRLSRALAKRLALGPPSREARLIALNLARMRAGQAWRAADSLLINIPAFEAELRLAGKEVGRYRVVVGGARKMRCDERRRVMVPAHATPELDSRIEELVLAPYWIVTERIRHVELEAEQAKDPVYFEKNGYEVLGDGTPHEQLRQLPGRNNALGFVKLVFPNDARIFLHDTPEQWLFAREKRAASHGCVRVQGAWSLARRILIRDGGWKARYGRLRARWSKIDFSPLRRRWDRERYESLRARAIGLETRVKLARPLAVATTYLTARVDGAGRVTFLPDIYGKDAESLGEAKARSCTPESKLAVRAFASTPARVVNARQRLAVYGACLARPGPSSAGYRRRAENLARRILEGHRKLAADLTARGGRWRWRLIKRAMQLQHLVAALERQLRRAERACGGKPRSLRPRSTPR